tara:strand:+ start:6279 stop:6767 length:489 start_codon:yes stop_codon:yes gene_type:complete
MKKQPEDKSFKNSSLKEKFGMAKNFAQAILSRGISNKKVDDTTKRLRVLSCLGDGGELTPCEYLRQSDLDETKHYCGGCGCGDREGTWLIAEADKYSKLDYPKVVCPLNMPGFINYEQSEPDEAEEPITRRYYIEQLSEEQVQLVQVRVPDPPEPKKDTEEK